MAGTSFSPFRSRFLLASTVLLLFIPPIFSMLVFFWPLIVSTVLSVLAVVSFGQHRFSTGQEQDTSESRVANPDSSTADMEKISDVLMVRNQEVTWLEWLHNEDMEKCLAQEHADCMPSRWNLDELDVTGEASVGNLSLRVKEKSMVDGYGRFVAEEMSAHEEVENAADLPSTATPCDDIWVRTQVDKKLNLVKEKSMMDGYGQIVADEIFANEQVENAADVPSRATPCDDIVDKKLNLVGPVSPDLDVSRADAIGHIKEDGDVVRVNAESLKVENTTNECVLAGKAMNLMQNRENLLIAEGVLGANAFTMPSTNGSKSVFAERDEVETSIARRPLAVQGERIAHAVALEVRDVTTTPRGGSELAADNQTSERTSVDADGECILTSLTSKVCEASFAKEHASFTPEMEALEGHGMRHIHADDAEERDSRKNNEGPIWDVSDEEESKSSLRFSFFNNGCLTLNSSKAGS